MAVFLYAGILGFIYIGLSFNVIGLRRKYMGQGGEADIKRASRVHGNFSEYVPFTLLLMFMAESAGTNSYIIHVLGIILVIGRLFHAKGLGRTMGVSKGRTVGMVMTFSALLVAAVLCLINFATS